MKFEASSKVKFETYMTYGENFTCADNEEVRHLFSFWSRFIELMMTALPYKSGLFRSLHCLQRAVYVMAEQYQISPK